MSNYVLRFLPQFSDDLNRVVLYISNTLRNIDAANSLIKDVAAAIAKRLNNNPESFEKFPSKKQRLYPYYRIYVENYVIYYVVIHTKSESIMEVRRFLHKRQNCDALL